MAKWNTAVHAARTLLAQFDLREVLMELVPILHPFERANDPAAVRARYSMNPVGLPIVDLLLISMQSSRSRSATCKLIRSVIFRDAGTGLRCNVDSVPAHPRRIVFVGLERRHRGLIADSDPWPRPPSRLRARAGNPGHDLDEFGRGLLPDAPRTARPRAAGIARVALDQLFDFLGISIVEAFDGLPFPGCTGF